MDNFSFQWDDPTKSLAYLAGLHSTKNDNTKIIITYNYISTQYLYIILIGTLVINNKGDSKWRECIVYNDG